MKKILYFCIILLLSNDCLAQAKKPTIMVVPSRQWCISRGYYTTIDNFGVKEQTPDYQKAFDEVPDLIAVISTINDLFKDRDFPLVDLSATLNSIRTNNAEDAALNMDRQNNGQGAMAESMFDKVRNRAKADIVIEIQWEVNKTGMQRSVSFTMRGLDAYSDKQVAGANGTGQPSTSSVVSVLLREAVLAHIDNFNARLQSHFDDLFANGREIRIDFRKDANWDKDFDTDFGSEELSAQIETWLSKNTVKGRFTTQEATETKLVFTQVRIPMYDANQRAIDARAYGRDLVKYLKGAPFNISTKVVNKGLGYVQLICGGK